jgi:hypothetical protein
MLNFKIFENHTQGQAFKHYAFYGHVVQINTKINNLSCGHSPLIYF